MNDVLSFAAIRTKNEKKPSNDERAGTTWFLALRNRCLKPRLLARYFDAGSIEAPDGEVDIAGAGSTIKGRGNYFKEQKHNVTMVAVEPGS